MKFYGKVGFWDRDVEVAPDVYEPVIIERVYVGEVTRDNRNFSNNQSQNENFIVSNNISILSDLYLQKNWSSIRYVVWNGEKLKVSNVDVNYPRITLRIGGVWNGETQS